MKIKFEKTKEQLELVKAMASTNREEAFEAQQAMADFVAPVLSEVINTAPTLSNLFADQEYNFDDNPSLPLELYYDITDEDYIKVYSQALPGGLPTNEVVPTQSELKFRTYPLDSAISFDKKYARRSRLDVVGKSFVRMGQEVLMKQERTSANLLLGTLADNASDNVITASSAVLLPGDFNNLVVKAKRLNSSWTSGTPESKVGSITDILLSPERMADIRAMAYNPINSVAANQGAAGQDSAAITAPDAIRAGLFNGAGLAEFYGFAIREINELGLSKRYTNVYQNLDSGDFDASTDDLVVAVDLSSDGLVRMVAADPDSNAQMSILVDDQFVTRQRKMGWFAEMEEGRMVINKRVVLGLRVDNANT